MNLTSIINNTTNWHIEAGNALEVLKKVPDSFIQVSLTSPPYYGLRDYENQFQLGIEKTPKDYIDKIVIIYKEIKRILRDDGTVWINMGDKYTIGNKKIYKNLHLKHKDLMGLPWELAFALRFNALHFTHG